MLPKSFSEISRRVETDRFGPFVFQLGFVATGVADVTLALQRVEDAHERGPDPRPSTKKPTKPAASRRSSRRRLSVYN